ncbi:MAG: N-formylglutamate amidohydrolase [Alphaproteobacteria bacterium]
MIDRDSVAPYEAFFMDEAAKPLLLCDHASNHIPASLNDLGLSKQSLAQHIAYDIGAGGVTKLLSQALGYPALLGGVSRLMIDLNRPVDDPTSIRQIYDHIIIKGNIGLDQAAITHRIDTYFTPYHQAISDHLQQALMQRAALPMILSIHSYTPKIRAKGVLQQRPWHLGILSNQDRRLSTIALDYFAQHHPELTIGDNLPYSGEDAYDYTLSTHVFPKGYLSLLVEIRQDLIDTQAGQEQMAQLLLPLMQKLDQAGSDLSKAADKEV